MRVRDGLGVVLVCGLCYVNFGGGTFHYDAFHSLVENPHIRSLANIPGFFADPGAFSGDAEKKMYRPLLLVSYAVQYALHGLEPLGYLLGNWLIHCAVSLLVGALVSRILDDPRAGLVGALFFAAHPLAGEPVNYISSRSESLAASFYLATFLLHNRGRRELALICFALGLLVKSVVITAPVLLWAYDRWQRAGGRDWRRYMPFAGVAFGYIMLISYNRFLLGSLAAPVRDWTTQLMTQCKASAYYLYLIAMPFELNVEHQFFETADPFDRAFLAGAGLGVSLGFLAWFGRFRIPGWVLIWSMVILLPTVLLPLNMLVNERRLYLVMAGLACGVGYLSRRFEWCWQMAWVICAIALCLSRNSLWGSDLSIWGDAVKKAPRMYRTQSNWGKALQMAGREEEALAAYRRAISIDDRHADAYNNIATLYHLRGEVDQAIAWYLRALERHTNMEEIHQNLGDAYAQKGNLDLALAAYRRALDIDPKKGDIWSNYGLILYGAGDLPAAEAALRRAIELLPNHAEPYNNLANIHVDRDQYRQAEMLYEQALEYDPEDRGEILANLGALYRSMGRFDAGRQQLEEAIARRPSVADWHYRRGRLEREAGRREEAQDAFSAALKLAPDHARARVQHAELLSEGGVWQPAIAAFRRALSDKADYSRAWYGLGRALEMVGDGAAALQAYSQFLAGWQGAASRTREVHARIEALEGDS